jgi:peroxiredoxin
MPGITVGQAAPSFRLPSAQGPEVGLDDYRGRRNVIVWFTKGMACVFCRQHMSQLARALPEFAKRGTELLEVTPTPIGRARFYAQKYPLPFPYLSDAGDAVRRTWQLDVRSHGPVWYAKALVAGMKMEPPANDFGQGHGPITDLPMALRDEDSGFFVVDRAGVVRYAYAGSYVEASEGQVMIRPLPPLREVLQELDRCAA